jgi:chromosome segregation ATPase
VHLEAQLLEARSRQGVFSTAEKVSKKKGSRNDTEHHDHGENRHHDSGNGDAEERNLQGGIRGVEEGGGGVSQRQCAELRSRISAGRAALSEAQQQLKSLREQLRSGQADHAAHMYLLKQRASEAKVARQHALEAALTTRRSSEAELESSQKQANESTTQASSEVNALKEAQASEIAAVDSRVATVLARKESAVAELAEKLQKLATANDQRSTALDRLRQGRAVA